MRNNIKKLFYLIALMVVSAARAGAYEDFFKAVELDNPRLLGAILAQGFDPNTLDPRGHTALYLALREGSTKAAETLVAQPDIRIDAENRYGETALMMAALKGRVDWCKRLIERGARVDKDGWTPLHYAAVGPEVATVRLMLDRGARVDPVAPDGSTPLMLAAREGAIDAVPLLLEHGADPRLRSKNGMTAADFAKAGGRDKLAAKLAALAR